MFQMVVELKDYQKDAVAKMKNGCILNGGVGSGKSITALYYFFQKYGGRFKDGAYIPMDNPPDLYIITTARKRDTKEWEHELGRYCLSTDVDICYYKDMKVVVDSWNNIKKYAAVRNAFFIFDEDKVTGSGVWVRTFLHITRYNEWIILSATPGDKWIDYVPVFIANGYFRNKTQFEREHVVYSPFTNFPQVLRYTNTGRLTRLRKDILVNMDFDRPTEAHHEDVWVTYDVGSYKDISKSRWNPYENKPIENASEYCYCLRKNVNLYYARIWAVLDILAKHPRAIVFYNFDAELELLREMAKENGIVMSEWNGHKHEDIPTGEKWIYAVHYNACEGWNCTSTDTMIFYSQNYSYKTMIQAAGRIDRMNTPYHNLYYFHLKSRSSIDLAINRALSAKKKFNEGAFYGQKSA